MNAILKTDCARCGKYGVHAVTLPNKSMVRIHCLNCGESFSVNKSGVGVSL